MRRLLRRVGIYLVCRLLLEKKNFFLPRLAPGNPAEIVFERLSPGGEGNPEGLEAMELHIGVNTTDPLWVRCLSYLRNLLHCYLGFSTNYYPTPVIVIIAQHIKCTLFLLTVSVLLSFACGTLIGVFMAWRRGSALDSS